MWVHNQLTILGKVFNALFVSFSIRSFLDHFEVKKSESIGDSFFYIVKCGS